MGSQEKIREKEAKLRDQGYRAVAGPEILPMQYQITSEPMLGTLVYKLVWNETDAGH
jgi:hypothetical protein